MVHQGYRHEDEHDYRVEEGQRRKLQAMKLILMAEPTRWGSDGGKGVYCGEYWSRVVAGDGDKSAIDCWGALNPEEGRQEGGKNLRWGKESPEGGGQTVLG
jgi:hypothetical protein